jgi:peptide/nickel transport system ATP-binding protein
MSSIPRIGDRRDRLQTIPGTMPDLVDVPPGCSFHPRCPFAEESCTRREPGLLDPETGMETDDADHVASCLAYTDWFEGELDYEVEIRGEEDPQAPLEGEDD